MLNTYIRTYVLQNCQSTINHIIIRIFLSYPINSQRILGIYGAVQKGNVCDCIYAVITNFSDYQQLHIMNVIANQFQVMNVIANQFQVCTK